MRIDAPPTLQCQVDELERVMAAAHIGAFHVWIDGTDEANIHWDESLYLLHGLDPTIRLEHPGDALRAVHPEDLLRFIDAFTRVARGEHIVLDYRVLLADGTTRVLRILTDWFGRDPAGHLWCVGHAFDATEHRRLVDSAASANELSSAVLDTLENDVIILGRDGRVLAANARWRRRFPEVAPSDSFDLAKVLGPDAEIDTKLFSERLGQLFGGAVDEAELEFVLPPTADAGRRYVQARFTPIERSSEQFMGVFTDVTAMRESTVQILHTQKLEAVGQLASGIAHEINTPIQFVGDNLHFIRDGCTSLIGAIAQLEGLIAAAPADAIDPDLVAKVRDEAELDYLADEIPAALAQALSGVDRVARIVHAMKAFGHPGDSSIQHAADINELIANALVVAQNEIKYVADVLTDLAELPPVMCYSGDLGQVVLNLLVNAAHAIADRVAGTPDRGRITVRTSRDATLAVITVQDDGGGIPEAIAHRVFDPFFTTKEVGRGTGQGLAIARSIVVDRHRGSLTFDTEPGVGTTFRIEIPLHGIPPTTAAATPRGEAPR